MSTAEAATIDDLRKDFHELYGNGHDFEGETLAEILVRIGHLVGDIVGQEEAAAGFAAIARALDCAVKIDAEWQDAIERGASDAYCWPMGVKFHDLNAYAYYGIALNGGRNSAEREAIIKAQIEATSAFMASIPFEAWGLKPGDAGRTLQRARARFALDTGQAVKAEDLALLGDVSEGRIRNMMAGKEKAFSSEQGRIPASEALAWLAGRPEVLPAFAMARTEHVRRPASDPSGDRRGRIRACGGRRVDLPSRLGARRRLLGGTWFARNPPPDLR